MGELRFLTVTHFPGPKIAEVSQIYTVLTGNECVRITRGERMRDDLLTDKPLRIVKGSRLADFLWTPDRVLVVSERTGSFLEAQGLGGELQLLPFRLCDRKGAPRSERYALGQPFRKIDCLDPSRCEAELWTNPVSGEKKWMVESVQVDVSKIPPDARLFRLGEAPEVILIRSDLLQAIQDAGLTGLVAKELGQPLIDI
jgi:hypothetical protein